eukprot:4411590-Prymnesium_polylepis.1
MSFFDAEANTAGDLVAFLTEKASTVQALTSDALSNIVRILACLVTVRIQPSDPSLHFSLQTQSVPQCHPHGDLAALTYKTLAASRCSLSASSSVRGSSPSHCSASSPGWSSSSAPRPTLCLARTSRWAIKTRAEPRQSPAAPPVRLWARSCCRFAPLRHSTPSSSCMKTVRGA